MIFQRKKYLDRLIAGQGNGLVKIVTGGRRCGKSFLLFNLFHSYLASQGISEDHIIELSFDDRKSKPLRNPDALLDYIESRVSKDGRTYFVILDEVQMVEEFVEVLLTLMHNPQLDVYVSGSNSRLLLSFEVVETRYEFGLCLLRNITRKWVETVLCLGANITPTEDFHR